MADNSAMNVTKNNVDLVYDALLKHFNAIDFGAIDVTGCLGMRDNCCTKLLLYSDKSPLDNIRSATLADILIDEGIYSINDIFYGVHLLEHTAEAKLAFTRTVLHYLKHSKVFIDTLGYGQPFAPQKVKCYEQFMITYELTAS